MQIVTADVRSQGHLTVVNHGLPARSSESPTKAAAVHLGAAEPTWAERLKHTQRINHPAARQDLGLRWLHSTQQARAAVLEKFTKAK